MVGIILLNGLEEELGRHELRVLKHEGFGTTTSRFNVNIINDGVISAVKMLGYREDNPGRRFEERLLWDGKPVGAIAGDRIEVVITFSPAAQSGLAALVEPVRSIWDQLRDEV